MYCADAGSEYKPGNQNTLNPNYITSVPGAKLSQWVEGTKNIYTCSCYANYNQKNWINSGILPGTSGSGQFIPQFLNSFTTAGITDQIVLSYVIEAVIETKGQRFMQVV